MDAQTYGELNVDQIKQLLDDGELTADQVRDLERESGKDRKTVARLVDDEPVAEPTPPTEPAPVVERPRRSRAFTIDPKLVAERERQRQRLAESVGPRKTPKATIDPALVAARKATKAKEEALRGRSLRQPPITGR